MFASSYPLKSASAELAQGGVDDYDDNDYDGGEEEEDDYQRGGGKCGGNNLPAWGNVQTMNLNPLIMTNIQSSPYFKVNLVNFKTYHQVIDEIYYKVDHLEPWERGSRKTSGQTGMCGGVRGVGAGGIVSSSYCLLFKLYTLKLTRKQVMGMLNHRDSPYIRGLGFMYVRYTQPPADLWDWFEQYLDDEEEIDPKAGGGKSMTIGNMVTSFLTKLEWFDTRFPRMPINVQKQIDSVLMQRGGRRVDSAVAQRSGYNDDDVEPDDDDDEDRKHHQRRRDRRSRSRSRDRERRRGGGRRSRSRDSRHRRRRERSSDDDARRRHQQKRKKKNRSRSRSRGRRR